MAVIVCTMPAMAEQEIPELEPAWVIEHEEGYLFLDVWPGCNLLYASTFMGDIQAIDAAGSIAWSVNPGMSWPELGCASDGTLWASDGAGIARVDSAGELVFNTNAFATGVFTGNPASAAYVDIETGLIYGIEQSGACTWESAQLAPDLRLASMLPAAAGVFIVEANDYDNARQEFLGLSPDGGVSWRFDATAYGQMPIAGVYPVLRADGSVLLAPVTHSGEIGGELGEYGSLLSLGADGELEWAYPRDAYLLSFHPAADGSVHVVLPDYTIRRVGRDGRDRWTYAYGSDEYVWGVVTLPDGGALVCYSWSGGELLSQPTLRVVHLNSGGLVTGEYVLSHPEDTYWYLQVLDGLLVCLDGDFRLAAFKVP